METEVVVEKSKVVEGKRGEVCECGGEEREEEDVKRVGDQVMVTKFDVFETNGQEEVGEVVWVLVGVCNVDGDRTVRLVLILGHGENDERFKLCFYCR